MSTLINPAADIFQGIPKSYITPTEYKNAPTGVDISRLVPYDTDAAESEELKRTIARASALIDAYCQQPLSASKSVETKYAFVRNDGTVKIRLEQFPILEVVSVAYQLDPTRSAMTSVDVSQGVILHSCVQLFAGAGIQAPAGKTSLFTTTYVAGFPNTTSTSAVSIGASVIPVQDSTGMYPGALLKIFDDQSSTEQVTVLSVAGNTVTLTAPLSFAHATGVAVSAIPEGVREAAILMTSALIKTRGSESIVMNSLNAPPQQMQTSPKDLDPDIALAKQFLSQYRRVWA